MTAREKVVSHLKGVYKTEDLLFVDFKPLPDKLQTDGIQTDFARGSVRMGSGMIKGNFDVLEMIDDFLRSNDTQEGK